MPDDLPQGVSKLVALKPWLELDEAAAYLSKALGEPVHYSDLLRLGLERHLTLSVRFVSAVNVKCGKRVPLPDVPIKTLPALEGSDYVALLQGTAISNDYAIVWEEKIHTTCDVWDLPMLGGDRLEVEQRYEKACFREPPELFNMEGAFITDGGDVFCQLMESFNNPKDDERYKNQPYHPHRFYPSATLPEDSVIVVRTKALKDLVALVMGDARPSAKPVGQRERNTLLTIIGALAQMAKVDVSKPSSAAAAIESQSVLMGARVPARTIEEHLKRVPEALESRQA